MLEIQKRVEQTIVIVSALDLADSSAELSLVLPRKRKTVAVDLPAETDRTPTELANSLESEVEPDARVGDVLVYHGQKVGHVSIDGVVFLNQIVTAKVPYSENTPAVITTALAGISGKLA